MTDIPGIRREASALQLYRQRDIGLGDATGLGFFKHAIDRLDRIAANEH
ncbi:hypothetical protein [Sphingorhabdus sp. SMR4y]|nr:hypothetical protein [Sphingorhabdus sp. SMR4y]